MNNDIKWLLPILIILLMGYFTFAKAEKVAEHRYQEDNTTGIYYQMTWDCDIFNPVTGQVLDDSNETKCKLYMYKDGSPIRKATPEEIQRESDREKQRERMYQGE